MKTNNLLFCLRGCYRPAALKPEPARMFTVACNVRDHAGPRITLR